MSLTERALRQLSVAADTTETAHAIMYDHIMKVLTEKATTLDDCGCYKFSKVGLAEACLGEGLLVYGSGAG